MKVIELHKKQMEWWKNKLGIDDYAVAWIAFIKGLIIGVEINNKLIAKIILININIINLYSK